MDRPDAQIALILVLALIVGRERERLEREREIEMAGEIRDKMAKLREARQKMIETVAAEIDDVIEQTHATAADAVEAMKLPRAEVAAHRQEIAEIRAEFAPLSNGGPVGPLPGDEKPSPQPSVPSATPPAVEPVAQAEQQPQQPQASWGARSGLD